MTDAPRKPRGLAAMSPERRREIASMGGKSVPADRRGFAVDPAAAAEAGRTGGRVSKRSGPSAKPKP